MHDLNSVEKIRSAHAWCVYIQGSCFPLRTKYWDNIDREERTKKVQQIIHP